LFGLSAFGLPALAEARNKHRKRRRKVKFNEFGCVDVGKFCKKSHQCCSGICQGKMGKKRCKSHDRGTCQSDDDSCSAAVFCPPRAALQAWCCPSLVDSLSASPYATEAF
jgi:hypothetical protein